VIAMVVSKRSGDAVTFCLAASVPDTRRGSPLRLGKTIRIILDRSFCCLMSREGFVVSFVSEP
jgi:hypothetical protein